MPASRKIRAASTIARCMKRFSPSPPREERGSEAADSAVPAKSDTPLGSASPNLLPLKGGATRRLARLGASGSGMSLLLHRRELRRLMLGDERINDLVERRRAFEHERELIGGEADAVVGDTALRVIIGADALGAVAGSDLAAAVPGALGVALGAFELVKARAQHLHRLSL